MQGGQLGWEGSQHALLAEVHLCNPENKGKDHHLLALQVLLMKASSSWAQSKSRIEGWHSLRAQPM